MPFGFGRKKDAQPAPTETSDAAADRHAPRDIRFHGLTEEWRLQGNMTIVGRLLDTLNKREAVGLSDVVWTPLGSNGPFEPAPGIRSIDPYDLIVVIAGLDTLPTNEIEERSAHRVHRITFDVALNAPPLRVVGTVQLHPGSEPDSLLERSSQMFVAITGPRVWLGGVAVDIGDDVDAVLVNRFYLRGVEQVDLSTGEKHVKMPGTPLGGTNWRERT